MYINWPFLLYDEQTFQLLQFGTPLYTHMADTHYAKSNSSVEQEIQGTICTTFFQDHSNTDLNPFDPMSSWHTQFVPILNISCTKIGDICFFWGEGNWCIENNIHFTHYNPEATPLWLQCF